MDIFNSVITYITDFAATSEAIYHVNPWVFCILFFGSAIPLYYGYYRIGKSALKFEDRKLKRKQIDRKELKTGIIISIIAWWIPYVYVIMFGKLPLNLWIAFIIFILVTGFFFIKTLRDKVSKVEEEIDE